MKKLLYLLAVFALFSQCKKDDTVPDTLPTLVTTFRESGLDVDWDRSGSDRIMYSSKGTDTYYDIHFANPDGSNDVCLTCDHPLLPNKHIANPGWHPSGKWIIMVVEEASHPGSSADALPGFGAYCDIWIMNDIGTKAYKIVDLPNDYDHGVIAPRFSPDGTKIIWTDRKTQPNILIPTQTFGFWTIKMANFAFGATDSIPYISNTITFEPVANNFYESYGFSPDGSKIIFCSSMNKPSVWDQQIYTMDTTGNNIVQLTQSGYNEHGFYKPDGSKIVWMSNQNSTRGGTDWWIMNPDGTDKKRLTFFNEKNNLQDAGHAVWAGLGSFSSTGTRFIGGVQQSLTTQEGKIVMVDLVP